MMGRGGRELGEWLAGLPALEPGTSSSSGFCPRARFPRMAPATWVNDVPLETVADRSAPMACGPDVDQARPLAGQRRSAWRTLPGKVEPRLLPRQASPATAIALLGGALAGSGPETSPCIDGLSLVTGMVVPQPPACSNHAHYGGWLGPHGTSRLLRAIRPFEHQPSVMGVDSTCVSPLRCSGPGKAFARRFCGSLAPW
jgi:hypothetical protein